MRPDDTPINARGGAPCRVCGHASCFAWKDQGRASLRPIVDALVPERALRQGTLYRCRVCGSAFYLDVAERMRRVPPGREELLKDWGSAPLLPSAAQKEALAAIGATERDRFGHHGRYRIPCRIRWRDGSQSDPCLVILTRDPPLNRTWLRVRLFRHVAEVSPTAFALGPDIRCATLRAEALAPGFAPTAVEGAGRRFLLNGAADLFAHVGVRGSDLRLVREGIVMAGRPPVVGQPLERATVVVGDVYEGCESLLLMHARNLV